MRRTTHMATKWYGLTDESVGAKAGVLRHPSVHIAPTHGGATWSAP